MLQEKTTEYKDKELLDEILNDAIKFMDENKNAVILNARDIFKAYCPAKATPSQLLEFKMKVEALGLDPRRGEVWMAIFNEYDMVNGKRVKIGEKVVVLTNYMVYVKRAWASEKMDTFKIEIEKPSKDPQTWLGKFIGKRKGMSESFETPPIPVSELNKGGGIWNMSPTVMTVVRMTSLGLRWMMADVLGGLPYTSEEMQGGLTETGNSDYKAENAVEDQGLIEDIEKERKELEQEKTERSEAEVKALSGYQAKIETFEDLPSLEKWAKVLNIEKHPFKDGILAMIEVRRQKLTPIEMYITPVEKPKDKPQDGPTRLDLINDIVKVTGAMFSNINAYVTDEIANSALVSAMLSGEAGALQEFYENLAEFLATQDEPESDFDTEAETDIPE